MGVAPDLTQATKDPLRAMAEHISMTYHLEPVEAYVLSNLVDLKISEVLDQPRLERPLLPAAGGLRVATPALL